MFSFNPAFVISETSDTWSFVERAQAGDGEAFGEVCRVYETRLLRQAMTLCGNAALAEDLAQDTLVEAWKCLLLNRYRNTTRQKRPMALSWLAGHDQDEFQDRLDKLADHASLPDHAAQLRERAALVRECIQALPTKHQQVIYLRFYVDDSLEEIAAALDCSLGTVKSRLFRALEKLRTMNVLNPQFENPKIVAADVRRRSLPL